jgi:hypothetical protein
MTQNNNGSAIPSTGFTLDCHHIREIYKLLIQTAKAMGDMLIGQPSNFESPFDGRTHLELRFAVKLS